MTETSKILLVVPSRFGSSFRKSEHLAKSMYPLNGKPMLHFTLESIKDLPYDKIISTDDKLVKAEAVAFGLNVHDRPRHLANDTATLDQVIHHLAQETKYESYVLLPPTSPLRTAEDITAALNEFHSYTYDSVISVTEEHRSIWSNNENEKYARPLVEITKGRQQVRPVYIANGAVFISHRDSILSSKRKISGRVGVYVMAQERSIDVHCESDIKLTEFYLNK